jgi:membrane protease YdiL (CAAX protease family)
MRPIRKKYAPLIQNLKLSTTAIVLLSFCAGFGEELLFRGALQPLLGIWITAIIFVAIHGYLNPRDWRLSVYGTVMTLIIVVLGYMTEVWGIFTACAAHMAIDIVLFKYLVDSGKNSSYVSLSET